MSSLITLLLEVSIDDLKRQFVDSGRIRPVVFEKIVSRCGNKSAYATWMCKRYVEGNLGNEGYTDEEWIEAFKTFEKFKNKFDKKDINQYKTQEDVNAFLTKVAEIQEEEKLKKINVDKFKIGAVEADGKGYLVYKLPKGEEQNYPVSIALGRTDHEALGSSGWCTASGKTDIYWRNHINKDDIYIFINPRDRKFDKYQLQYGYYDSRLFNIKDRPLSEDEIVPFVSFYLFLHEHEGRPLPDYIQDIMGSVNLDSEARLEDLQVQDNIYVLDPRSQNCRDLIVPLARDILGMSVTDAWRKISKNVRRNDMFIFSRYGRRWCSIAFNLSSKEFYSSYITDAPALESTVNLYNLLERARAESPESHEDLYFLFRDMVQAVQESAGISIPVRFKLTWEEDTFHTLDYFKKGVKGKITYYVIPSEEEPARAFVELRLRPRGRIPGGMGILKQGDEVVLLWDVERERQRPKISRFTKGTPNPRTSYNPDVIYEMYKTLREFDSSVIYPDSVAIIQGIKEGGAFDEYEIPTIGEASKLYEVPRAVLAELSQAYAIPAPTGNRGVLLGYIKKFQFLVDIGTGAFTINGRWANSNSVSFIESIPGLGKTLVEIYRHYGLDYFSGNLGRWVDKHQAEISDDEDGEENSEGGDESGDSERSRALAQLPRGSILEMVDSAVEAQMVENYRVKIKVGSTDAEFTAENCLHGSWSDFEDVLRGTHSRMLRDAISWAQDSGGEISDVYLFRNQEIWNGFFVVKNSRGIIQKVYRRRGTWEMGATCEVYSSYGRFKLKMQITRI